MEIKDMGTFKLLDAIEAWQGNPNVHELTCGKCEKSHVKLVGEIKQTDRHINISTHEGCEVVLKCPECGHIQEQVPDCVYQYHIENELSYNIPLGQVVEVDITDGCGADAIYFGKDRVYGDGTVVKQEEGVTGGEEIVLCFIGKLKSIVVGHSRDCDGTPLYCLSNIRVRYAGASLPDNIRGRMTETLEYKKWSEYLKTGFDEESLKVIEGQFVPLKYGSIFDYVDEMKRELESYRSDKE